MVIGGMQAALQQGVLLCAGVLWCLPGAAEWDDVAECSSRVQAAWAANMLSSCSIQSCLAAGCLNTAAD